MTKDVLIATNAQKILYFLIDNPMRDFLEGEIQQATKISKSGVNYALRDLVAADFLFRTKRGRSFFYTLNHKNLVVKQLKIIETITHLNSLLKKLILVSSKIILFGSSSRGENTPDSDIDLLLISRNKDLVLAEIKKYKGRKIQPIIWTNTDLLEKKKTDPVFYDQINKGLVLGEGVNDEL
jgi:predicted nucleotidyltransferase